MSVISWFTLPPPQQNLAGRRAKKSGKRKKAEEHVFLCHVFRYSWLVEKQPQIFFGYTWLVEKRQGTFFGVTEQTPDSDKT